jgi:glutaminase
MDDEMMNEIILEAARIEQLALSRVDEFERRNGEGTSVDVLFNAGGMIVASALSLVDEDEREAMFVAVMVNIVQNAKIVLAELETNVLLNKIRKEIKP